MSASTGVIVAAGAVALADVVTGEWSSERAVTIATGVVVSSIVAAGLDKVVPGFGTGTAVVLLLASIMKYGPDLSKRINLGGGS